jgi:Tol biopolymer transport system component
LLAEVVVDAVLTFGLAQNYPNPFVDRTTIVFTTPRDGNVDIRVFDLLGRHVQTLVDEYVGSGEHRIEMNRDELRPGRYFYVARFGG